MLNLSKYTQGIFRPINPKKYNGNHTNIVYRSSWELRVMSFFDTNLNILEWNSEEFSIPYLYPIDKRVHRYYPDFKVKMKTSTGVKEYILEVKPKIQTEKPKKPKRMSKSYVSSCETFIKNQSKWEAAKIYAKQRNMEFMLLTEDDIFGPK